MYLLHPVSSVEVAPSHSWIPSHWSHFSTHCHLLLGSGHFVIKSSSSHRAFPRREEVVCDTIIIVIALYKYSLTKSKCRNINQLCWKTIYAQDVKSGNSIQLLVFLTTCPFIIAIWTIYYSITFVGSWYTFPRSTLIFIISAFTRWIYIKKDCYSYYIRSSTSPFFILMTNTIYSVRIKEK